MSLQVVVPTCNKYVVLMPGFFHQWQKYCGWAGMVVCETIAPELPPGWSFFKTGYDTEEKSWAGNLKMALEHVYEELVLLVLDDYWLTKQADTKRIQGLRNAMMTNQTIDKVDLTNDRIGFPHEPFGEHCVRSLQDAPYLTSTQAAIWRKSFLRKCLINPAWSPWQFELLGNPYIQAMEHKILGFRVPVMHYANVMLKGQINATELAKFTSEDMEELDDIDLRTGERRT